MVYSAWGEGGVASTVVPGVTLPDWVARTDPGLQLIRTFEADSWEDAMRQYHEWQGWGPYKPMPGTDDSAAIPEPPKL